MDNVLDTVLRRLLRDRGFLRSFRRDPDRALGRYDLAEEEIDALKRGDTAALVELGATPMPVWPQIQPGPPSLLAWYLESSRRTAAEEPPQRPQRSTIVSHGGHRD